MFFGVRTEFVCHWWREGISR